MTSTPSVFTTEALIPTMSGTIPYRCHNLLYINKYDAADKLGCEEAKPRDLVCLEIHCQQQRSAFAYKYCISKHSGLLKKIILMSMKFKDDKHKIQHHLHTDSLQDCIIHHLKPSQILWTLQGRNLRRLPRMWWLDMAAGCGLQWPG